MSSASGLPNNCNYETPRVDHVEKRIHDSVTNLRSFKRRRISFALSDVTVENLDGNGAASSGDRSGSTADRFISTRPKVFLPLNITPRTKRISKQFGLIDDRVLNFNDDTNNTTSADKDETMTLLRRSASSLFHKPPQARPTSVTENLSKRRNCLIVLDSPGISFDPDAYPITWSRRNLIGVACFNDVYYQDLNTKSVSLMCSAKFPGKVSVIQWGDEKHEDYIAMGTTSGSLEIWDTGTKGGRGTIQRTWKMRDKEGVKCISWDADVLAAGTGKGRIVLHDVRQPRQAASLEKHKSGVGGLQWSTDHNYLASGDKDGVVHIWDRRVGKSLVEGDRPTSKLRHKGSTKALAWCPWKPELLATGSAAPEGKIKIWNIFSLASHAPQPVHTISLNTAVLSLHWSPHCKELLSTHGMSFTPILPSRRSAVATGNPATNTSPSKLTYARTPLTNSITVHEYPSCKRLMTLSNAHASSVTHSCLSPNGESVFTVSPLEEAIKMWQVWSQRPALPRRESALDKYIIR